MGAKRTCSCAGVVLAPWHLSDAMDPRELDTKLNELDQLKARVAALETEMAQGIQRTGWVPSGYYTTYHLLAGMVLGLVAAAASLIFNIVGAPMFGKHPLELIRVYLTFPMGERALTLDAEHNGFILAAGCCLYLATGMMGGIPFHMILSRFFERAGFGKRFAVATVLGLGVWLVNFYGVLSWLQPLLIGGSWILERVPVFVAVSTHLVFGWTMLLMSQWGQFVPPSAVGRERAA